MKISALTLLFVCTVFMACHTKNRQITVKPEVADTAKFYPLTGFFKSQIEYVDLRNFPLYLIRAKDGKRDSTTINKDTFISLATVFLNRAISEQKVKALYKETVFHDLSTGSYTLNYSTVDPSVEVRNIDILLDEETHYVKRVFIKSVYLRGDTSIEEQCNWKAFKSFQINRSLQTKTGYASTELNYINWNDKP